MQASSAVGSNVFAVEYNRFIPQIAGLECYSDVFDFYGRFVMLLLVPIALAASLFVGYMVWLARHAIVHLCRRLIRSRRAEGTGDRERETASSLSYDNLEPLVPVFDSNDDEGEMTAAQPQQKPTFTAKARTVLIQHVNTFLILTSILYFQLARTSLITNPIRTHQLNSTQLNSTQLNSISGDRSINLAELFVYRRRLLGSGTIH